VVLPHVSAPAWAIRRFKCGDTTLNLPVHAYLPAERIRKRGSGTLICTCGGWFGDLSEVIPCLTVRPAPICLLIASVDGVLPHISAPAWAIGRFKRGDTTLKPLTCACCQLTKSVAIP
jgi:hypothetical protein